MLTNSAIMKVIPFCIQVTQLKITNNPFAKAFRENAADMLVS